MPPKKGSMLPGEIFYFNIYRVPLHAKKEYIFDKIADEVDNLVVTANKDLFTDNNLIHNVLIRMKTKENVKKIQEILIRAYSYYEVDTDQIVLSKCKKIEDALRFVTDIDYKPLYKGFSMHQFSFYCKSMNWALKTSVYSNTDPFVIGHKNFRKVLMDMHAEVRRSLIVLVPHKPYLVKKRFHNWRDQVVDWYNDWIINGFVHKKKQLYLYGPSNTGKTHFIRFLMEPYKNQVFMPTATLRFFLQGWNKSAYSWIFIDEFNLNDFSFEKWKQMVAGEQVQIESKYETPYSQALEMPMFFVSNINPPLSKEGFETRVKIVNSKNNGFLFNYDYNEFLEIDREWNSYEIKKPSEETQATSKIIVEERINDSMKSSSINVDKKTTEIFSDLPIVDFSSLTNITQEDLDSLCLPECLVYPNENTISSNILTPNNDELNKRPNEKKRGLNISIDNNEELINSPDQKKMCSLNLKESEELTQDDYDLLMENFE